MLTATSSIALAEVDLTPFASVTYAYQSNPLYQWSGASAPAPAVSDSLLRFEGGADARFNWSRQTLIANAAVRHFEYESLSYLTRTEELLSGDYEWSPTESVIAGAGYRHERRIVPFNELADVYQLTNQRELFMETENVASASVTLRFADAWRLLSRLEWRDLASPRPGLPDLNLHENSIREALRRELGKLSLGVDAEYLSGSYRGGGALHANDYRQVTLQLAGERSIRGFSEFSAALGFTNRDDTRGPGISTFTGLLRYQRTLTGKTSGEVFVRRAVNDYLTGASGEIDTGVGVRAVWQPTVKLQAEAGFAFTRTELPNWGGTAASSRRDRYNLTSLQLRYQAMDSLSISAYGRYASRSSNRPAFGFSAREIGVELEFKEPM